MAVFDPQVPQAGTSAPLPGAARQGTRAASWLRWVVIAVAVLVTCAVAVLWPLAASYQPTGFGGLWAGGFHGMPDGAGGEVINDSAGQPGQYLVNPTAGAFTIVSSILNDGPRAITIQAVTMLRPDQLADTRPGSPPPWPLIPAGVTMWGAEYGDRAGAATAGLASGCSYGGGHLCPLTALALPAGQSIVVAIPVKFTSACYYNQGWTGADVFWVLVRFGPFTHWVAIPAGRTYLFHQPALPGEPRADVTCPGKSSRGS